MAVRCARGVAAAVGVALALLGLLAVVPAAPAAAAQRDDGLEARRVLVLSLPALTWQQVLDVGPPVLTALLERSAVASLSVRTLGPVTTLAEAYATIGAGNRATAEQATAGLAMPPDAAYEGDLAEEVFERRCGCPARGSVLHLGIARVLRANERLLYGAEPGSLGQALVDAGRQAAVVANADRTLASVGGEVHREAALAVMDRRGRIDAGSVGPQLLTEDPSAPFGVRLDLEATIAAVSASLENADVVLVEMSDLDRVERYADVATPEATEAARAAALERADVVLAAALDEIDLERDVVLVVAPTEPGGVPSELTVAAAAGPGFEPGLLRSAATRRDGYVTLPDIAPTVLDRLGVDIPDAMTGTIASSAGGAAPDAATFRRLAADNEMALFRDEVTGPTSVAFIVFQVLTYALAAVALTRWPRARPWVALMALTTLAVPPLAFLSGAVRYDGLTVPGYVLALLAAAAGLAALALGAEGLVRRRVGAARPLVAPLLLVGLTLTVLVLDVVVGAPLQINTVFGYSPTVAGRFAGFGNLAFALLAASAIVATTAGWGAAALRTGGRAPRRRGLATAAVGVVLAVVVLVDGLPGLGSDVGGVLAMVPGFAIIVLLLAGSRVGPQRLALIAVATAVAVGAFAAVDLARPEESRTHLGRLAGRVVDGGGEGLGTVLHRKLNANISILTSSVWTWVIPVALAFLAFLVWRRPRFLRELQGRVPGLRATLVGALVVGLLGFALNDSGVAVPAMMLAVLLPYVTFLVLRTSRA